MKDLFGEESVRALSWKQPFASLMLNEKIETRTWATNYRGLVLICASKKPYTYNELFAISGKEQYHRILRTLESHKTIPQGEAIAIGRLVDCRKMKPEDEDKCFVEYNPDLYCHIYQDVKSIKPFTWKGTQGWKKLDKSIIENLTYK